jgi:hypothetical protein
MVGLICWLRIYIGSHGERLSEGNKHRCSEAIQQLSFSGKWGLGPTQVASVCFLAPVLASTQLSLFYLTINCSPQIAALLPLPSLWTQTALIMLLCPCRGASWHHPSCVGVPKDLIFLCFQQPCPASVKQSFSPTRLSHSLVVKWPFLHKTNAVLNIFLVVQPKIELFSALK